MLRYLIMAAAFCLAGCVTPMSAADQTPHLQYGPPNRTLVAVIDNRERVEQGRPETFAGYARVMYGIPTNWNVEILMFGAKEDKELTMAELLAKRIAAGLDAQGDEVLTVPLTSVLDDAAARALLEREQADRLMTVRLRDWHFDVNTSWVGRFQFNSDATVTVHNRAGAIMSEQFAERQSIQAAPDDSWPNLILAAYRAKLEQILHDPDVRSALTAPPAAEAEAAPAEATAGEPML